MALGVLKEIRKIYAAVNADAIRAEADRDLAIGLTASSEASYRDMEEFLAPAWLPEADRDEVLTRVSRLEGLPPHQYDLVLSEPGMPVSPNGYTFDLADPAALMSVIVDGNPHNHLALARHFPGFRRTVADKIISRVARENAFFALVTALPNVIPSFFDIPWAFGEFATDTAFITMNQVRMALMLAAAHNRPIGFREQKIEIAAIGGGAFGWRALARELVGKIPLGGGLIPKAAVAYAGTYVVGLGLEKINRNGEGLSKWEKREAYADALARGKAIVREFAPPIARKNA